MANNIRITKDARAIIDFYRKEQFVEQERAVISDSQIVDIILRRWLFDNYPASIATDVLDHDD